MRSVTYGRPVTGSRPAAAAVEVPAVLVVSYRSAELLRQCLGSVEQHLPGAPVLVHDNLSDGSAAVRELMGERPAVDASFGARNDGFAAGVNVLARRARTAHPDRDLLLLNPDATLLGPLLATRAALLDPTVAAAAPRITGAGRSHDVAHRRPTLVRTVVSHAGAAERLRGTVLSDLYRVPPATVDGYLTGSCLLLSRRAWDAVGELDERFFLYGEEVVWQRRARLAGWTLRLADEDGARHRSGGTVAGDALASERSRDMLRGHSSAVLDGARRPAPGGAAGPGAFLTAALVALDAVQRSKRAERAAALTARAEQAPARPSVLVTTNTLGFGGAERQRVLLANALAERGHPVVLVCLQGFGPLLREVDPRVRVVLRTWWTPAVDVPPGDVVLVTGTTATEVGFGRLWRSAAALRRSGRSRWLVAAHTPPEPDGPVYPAAVARTVRSSDGVVALSPRHWAELTAHQRLHDGTVFFAPNGVDLPTDLVEPGASRAEPVAGRPVGPLRLVVLGRVTAVKQPHLLVAALAGLTELPWVLDIFGDGPDRAWMQEQTPPSLAGRVRWRGWASGPDEALAGADLLCVPSRREAFPLVVVEAMVRGVAVAASAVCAVPDLLDDGRAGVLVDPPDVEAWRTALRAVLERPGRLVPLAAAGRARAHERYTTRSMTDAYLSAMGAVLDR